MIFLYHGKTGRQHLDSYSLKHDISLADKLPYRIAEFEQILLVVILNVWLEIKVLSVINVMSDVTTK